MSVDPMRWEFDSVGHHDLVVVEVNPPEGLLRSMAMRLRHDFGLLPEDQQKVILGDMRKLHEEVVGKGFYKY